MHHTNIHKVSPPTILQLEVTKNCNNACIMCHKGQVAPGDDFNRDDIKEVYIEQIKPVYPYLRHAMLFGDGEPMLYRYFWDIVKDIRQKAPKCCIDFINNGSMMHEKNIQNCLDYNVSHIGLSMGGATEHTHNYIRKLSKFNEVVGNYVKLRDMKKAAGTMEPYVTSLLVVMKSNLNELPDFIRLSNALGFIRVEFQRMFVTHPMVAEEEVFSNEVEPIFRECGKIAKEAGIGFGHYPLDSGKFYGCEVAPARINVSHPLFRPKSDVSPNGGYCKYKQPWNSVYVLHDGKVVPDCHWWTSVRETELNECGQLDEHTNILDIWNGKVYTEIRDRILKGQILPQCRGCGFAGGVIDKFRSAETDHTNPDQEGLMQARQNGKISLPVLSNKDGNGSCSMTSGNIPVDLKNWASFQYDKSVLETACTSDDVVNDTPFYLRWRKIHDSDSDVFGRHQRLIEKYNPQFDYNAYLNNIELAYQERESKKTELSSRPIYIDLEPYNLCSYRCMSCQSSLNNRGFQIPDTAIEQILEMIPYAEQVEYAKIGEIFMLPEKILPIMRRVRHLNPCIVMRTNTHGQTLNDDVIQTLVDIEFDQLSISLDAWTQEGFKIFRNGDLKHVLSNLKKIDRVKKENGLAYPKLVVCSQLQRYCEPLEIVRLAHSVGADTVVFQAMVVYPKNEVKYNISQIQAPDCYGGVEALNKKLADCKEFCKEHKMTLAHPLDEKIENHHINFGNQPCLLSLYHKDNHTCPTGDPWYRFCMNGNGELSPCCFHSTFMRIKDESLHTNVPAIAIPDFWNSTAMKGLRKMLASGVYSPGCFCWKRNAFTTDEQSVDGPLDQLFEKYYNSD